MTGFPQNFRVLLGGISYQPLWAIHTDEARVMWAYRCPGCSRKTRFETDIEIDMDVFAQHRRCDACEGDSP